jgi:hypothetical protein
MGASSLDSSFGEAKWAGSSGDSVPEWDSCWGRDSTKATHDLPGLCFPSHWAFPVPHYLLRAETLPDMEIRPPAAMFSAKYAHGPDVRALSCPSRLGSSEMKENSPGGHPTPGPLMMLGTFVIPSHLPAP